MALTHMPPPSTWSQSSPKLLWGRRNSQTTEISPTADTTGWRSEVVRPECWRSSRTQIVISRVPPLLYCPQESRSCNCRFQVRAWLHASRRLRRHRWWLAAPVSHEVSTLVIPVCLHSAERSTTCTLSVHS